MRQRNISRRCVVLDQAQGQPHIQASGSGIGPPPCSVIVSAPVYRPGPVPQGSWQCLHSRVTGRCLEQGGSKRGGHVQDVASGAFPPDQPAFLQDAEGLRATGS